MTNPLNLPVKFFRRLWNRLFPTRKQKHLTQLADIEQKLSNAVMKKTLTKNELRKEIQEFITRKTHPAYSDYMCEQLIRSHFLLELQSQRLDFYVRHRRVFLLNNRTASTSPYANTYRWPVSLVKKKLA
jgi:hypothetical protein